MRFCILTARRIAARRCFIPLNMNPDVNDEYSGLANLLANLIAKYADVLDIEDEESQEISTINTNNDPSITSPRGSLQQASPILSIAKNQAA